MLRDKAPTLGSSRKLRIYALLGSLLMLLAVTGFYFAMQIYKAVSENREEDSLMQVESAQAIEESETEKALKRVEAEQAQADFEYEEQLEALKEVDLLEEADTAEP